MPLPAINLKLLLALYNNMEGRVTYHLGAKAPALDCDSHQIAQIDCSGFTRYAVAKASNQQLILPDGSANQHEYCIRQSLRPVRYEDAATRADDGRLFICFLPPSPIGHVWLLSSGLTIESHGSHGVDRRPWDTPVLRGCQACYELAAS